MSTYVEDSCVAKNRIGASPLLDQKKRRACFQNSNLSLLLPSRRPAALVSIGQLGFCGAHQIAAERTDSRADARWRCRNGILGHGSGVLSLSLPGSHGLLSSQIQLACAASSRLRAASPSPIISCPCAPPGSCSCSCRCGAAFAIGPPRCSVAPR